MEFDAFGVAIRTAANTVAECEDGSVGSVTVVLPRGDDQIDETGEIASRVLAEELGLRLEIIRSAGYVQVRFSRPVPVRHRLRPSARNLLRASFRPADARQG